MTSALSTGRSNLNLLFLGVKRGRSLFGKLFVVCMLVLSIIGPAFARVYLLDDGVNAGGNARSSTNDTTQTPYTLLTTEPTHTLLLTSEEKPILAMLIRPIEDTLNTSGSHISEQTPQYVHHELNSTINNTTQAHETTLTQNTTFSNVDSIDDEDSEEQKSKEPVASGSLENENYHITIIPSALSVVSFPETSHDYNDYYEDDSDFFEENTDAILDPVRALPRSLESRLTYHESVFPYGDVNIRRSQYSSPEEKGSNLNLKNRTFQHLNIPAVSRSSFENDEDSFYEGPPVGIRNKGPPRHYHPVVHDDDDDDVHEYHPHKKPSASLDSTSKPMYEISLQSDLSSSHKSEKDSKRPHTRHKIVTNSKKRKNKKGRKRRKRPSTQRPSKYKYNPHDFKNTLNLKVLVNPNETANKETTDTKYTPHVGEIHSEKRKRLKLSNDDDDEYDDDDDSEPNASEETQEYRARRPPPRGNHGNRGALHDRPHTPVGNTIHPSRRPSAGPPNRDHADNQVPRRPTRQKENAHPSQRRPPNNNNNNVRNPGHYNSKHHQNNNNYNEGNSGYSNTNHENYNNNNNINERNPGNSNNKYQQNTNNKNNYKEGNSEHSNTNNENYNNERNSGYSNNYSPSNNRPNNNLPRKPLFNNNNNNNRKSESSYNRRPAGSSSYLPYENSDPIQGDSDAPLPSHELPPSKHKGHTEYRAPSSSYDPPKHKGPSNVKSSLGGGGVTLKAGYPGRIQPAKGVTLSLSKLSLQYTTPKNIEHEITLPVTLSPSKAHASGSKHPETSYNIDGGDSYFPPHDDVTDFGNDYGEVRHHGIQPYKENYSDSSSHHSSDDIYDDQSGHEVLSTVTKPNKHTNYRRPSPHTHYQNDEHVFVDDEDAKLNLSPGPPYDDADDITGTIPKSTSSIRNKHKPHRPDSDQSSHHEDSRPIKDVLSSSTHKHKYEPPRKNKDHSDPYAPPRDTISTYDAQPIPNLDQDSYRPASSIGVINVPLSPNGDKHLTIPTHVTTNSEIGSNQYDVTHDVQSDVTPKVSTVPGIPAENFNPPSFSPGVYEQFQPDYGYPPSTRYGVPYAHPYGNHPTASRPVPSYGPSPYSYENPYYRQHPKVGGNRVYTYTNSNQAGHFKWGVRHNAGVVPYQPYGR